MKCSRCGTNAEAGRRFCTNCGNVLDNDDAVIRIIENNDVVNSNGNLRSKPKFRVSAAPIRRKVSKKKLIAFASSILAIILIFLTINFFKNLNKKEYKHNGEFVLMVKEEDGKRDLYLGEPNKAEVKIASDVAESYYYTYIKTEGKSRRYLYRSTEGDLYEVDGKGEKEKIGTKLNQDTYMAISADLKKYLFLEGDDNTLYLKENGKDKIKIGSNVRRYRFMQDSKTIMYDNEAGELFIRRNGAIDKLAENVRYAMGDGTSDGILYAKNDDTSYYLNLKNGEERKLNDSASSGIGGFDGEGNITYKKDNDLYYFKGGKEPIKVASNVKEYLYLDKVIVFSDYYSKWHSITIGSTEIYDLPDLQELRFITYRDGYIFYIDKYSTFSKIKQGTSDSEKIHDSVANTFVLEEELYFTANEGGQTLYKLEKDGSATKIQEQVTTVQLVDNSYMAYITEDNNLYIDGKKYSDVRDFAIGGKNICYINTDDELYLVEGKGTPKKICDDVTVYSELLFGGEFLVRFNIFTVK